MDLRLLVSRSWEREWIWFDVETWERVLGLVLWDVLGLCSGQKVVYVKENDLTDKDFRALAFTGGHEPPNRRLTVAEMPVHRSKQIARAR